MPSDSSKEFFSTDDPSHRCDAADMSALISLLFVTCIPGGAFAVKSTLQGNGDVLLTGLLNVRRSGGDDDCGEIIPMGLASVAGFLYAIDVVNNDSSLLQNVTLGYEIYDKCSSTERANEIAFSFARRSDLPDDPREERNATFPPGTIVVTSIGSDASLSVASMLQVKSIPMISTDATSESLSDARLKTFFRTVPSDAAQARAMADLIEHFNWTYVGIVADDGSYGQSGAIALEDEAHARQTFCVAFFETVSHQRKRKLERVVQSVKNDGKVRVIVLWTTRATAAKFFAEANRQNVYGRTWLAPDGWSQRWASFSQNVGVFRGFIGLNFIVCDVPAFRGYILESICGAWSGSALWKEFLGTLRQNRSGGGSACTNGSLESRLADELLEQMGNYPYLGFMIDAVHAAALVIGSACRHDNNTCANINGPELVVALSEVSFTGVTGQVHLARKRRSAAAAYNILNLQQEPSGGLVLKAVGAWHGDRDGRERLVIRDDWIDWPGEGVAVSACSSTCPPGKMQTPAVFCCWECLPCTGPTISERPGSANCTRCAPDERPNDRHDACAKLPDVTIQWGDGVVMVIVGCASLGMGLVIFVLMTYIRFRATPVVKSSSPDISYCLMVAISLGFVSVIISLLRPSAVTCYSAHALSSLCLVTCVSVLFLKTNRLLLVFNLSLLSSSFTRWCCGQKSQFILLGLLHLTPLTLLVLWIVLDPPRADLVIEPMRAQHLECKMATDGPARILLPLVFAYLLAISIVCTWYAFKARKLPGNFNEAKFITFAMCVQLMCVVSMLTVYGSLAGSYLVEFDCGIRLLSAFGFLLCIFGPKIYVIYRHPEKNTTEYVKSVVTNHTLRNASNIYVGRSEPRSGSVLAARESNQNQSRTQSESTAL